MMVAAYNFELALKLDVDPAARRLGGVTVTPGTGSHGPATPSARQYAGIHGHGHGATNSGTGQCLGQRQV